MKKQKLQVYLSSGNFQGLCCIYPSNLLIPIDMLIWSYYLSGLGIMQGVLLAVLLFTRKINQKANKFLGAFICVLLVSLTEHWYQPMLPGLFSEILGGFLFLYGPLMLLYVKSLLGESLSLRNSIGHFAGFGLYILGLLAGYLLIEIEREIAELVLAHILFIHLLYYSFLTLNRIHLESRKEAFSVTYTILNWLKAFTGTLAAIYLVAFIGMYLRIMGLSASNWILFAVQTGCVLVVYGFSYWSLVQPEASRKQKEEVKYAHSGLSEPDQQILLNRILAFFTEHKPYFQPTFTLDQFARNMGTNRFYISQVINERTGKNFSDFLNAYRIEEAKRILTDPKKSHYSVVGAGYEAGFNSKTAFNTAFKKLTGYTPGEFRKLNREEVRIEQTGQ
ncbi:helix-turn-helix transcriptional regulator [Rhodocytophaga rosea]|uniref:Helix-turn-helix transcriptional regulator n=1 Tax=Rhodocytophaga rosea TaxID=2704465 RepID=A0A6C0GKQ6_9BACT|nr:AraC family transcriptional regulator [Rhodocytophaga rosea]QHT68559.1 helix-turn-helix transcriptional regulator [Rhodocytophaga rosea]